MAEFPEGYREVSPEDRKKAQAFFDYGRAAASTGNYDYAIELYLNGFKSDPDAVAAHQELRDISMRRKASGGKGMKMFDAMRLKKNTKDDRENLLNMEKLLAYDPGNSDHMLGIAESAKKAGYYDTVNWIAPILMHAEADGGKPDAGKFLAIKDILCVIKNFKLAQDAIYIAMRLKPGDMDLQSESRRIGAEMTMHGAGYDKGGSFRDQVKDMDAQRRLLDQDKEITTDDDMNTRLVVAAEKEANDNPNEPSKALKLAEILVKTAKPLNIERAVKLLEEWYVKTQQFSFRRKIGQIRIWQMMQEEKAKIAAAAAAGNTPEGIAELEAYQTKRREKELEILKEWAEAYPTEGAIRFQIGRRQLELKQYEEAVGSFQVARNDPKLRVDAAMLLAQSFSEGGYLDEADDTLSTLIRDYANQEDAKFKEMLYLRGRVLEQKGQNNEAYKLYSKVFQLEAGYRDVAARVKRLRPPPGGQSNS